MPSSEPFANFPPISKDERVRRRLEMKNKGRDSEDSHKYPGTTKPNHTVAEPLGQKKPKRRKYLVFGRRTENRKER